VKLAYRLDSVSDSWDEEKDEEEDAIMTDETQG